MLKKMAIAGVIIVLLVVGVLGFALYNLNSLVEKIKPEIERVASNTLGAAVSITKLEAAIFPSAKLRIEGLKIGEAGAQDIKFGSIALRVSLLPLLSKKLDIIELTIADPEIVIIKDAAGIKLQGLPSVKKPSEADGSPKSSDEEKGKEPGTQPSGLALNLRALKLNGGSVVVKDEVAKKDYTISNLGLEVGVNLSASGASIPALTIQGKIMQKLEFEVKGSRIEFEKQHGQLSIASLVISSLGSSFNIDGKIKTTDKTGKLCLQNSVLDLKSLAPLADSYPIIKELALNGALKPAFCVEFTPKGEYAGQGLLGLSDIAFTAGGIPLSALAGTLDVVLTPLTQSAKTDGISFKVREKPLKIKFAALLEAGVAKLNSLSINAFSGEIAASGNLTLSADNRFAAKYDLSELKIEEILEIVSPGASAKLSGRLENLSGTLAGSLKPSPLKTLSGDTDLSLKDGVLKGINIGGAVLKATNLPFLSGALFAMVPEEFRAKLESENTEIKSLTALFDIRAGIARTNNLNLVHPLFTVEGSGSFALDSNIDFSASILFEKSFSAAMVGKVKELSAVLDSGGRLVIPFVIKGTLPNVKVLPDVKKLVQSGTKKLIEDKAGKALEGLLGGKKDGKSDLKGLFDF